jgi:molybdopterin converting factor small subunit
MPQATFWFASPFREWIGQRQVTLSWEGTFTPRRLFERLGAEHPRLHAHLIRPGLTDEALGRMAAVIHQGTFLSLDSPIPDGATVDILAPLTGGSA